MNFITAFFRFWYDFIVGDTWEIAAGVLMVLALGATLLRSRSVEPEAVPLLVAAGICAVAAISIAIEIRRRTRAQGVPPAKRPET